MRTATAMLDQFIDAIADRVVEKLGQTVVEPVEEAKPEKKEEAKPKKEKSSLNLVDLRAQLAEISRSGKQKEVKALITEFGGDKLTDLDESVYEDLIAKAKEL